MDKKKRKYIILTTCILYPIGFGFINESIDWQQKSLGVQEFSLESEENMIVIPNDSKKELKKKSFRTIEAKLAMLEDEPQLYSEDEPVLPKYLAKKCGTIIFGTRITQKEDSV
ncbi:hypothetical protein M2139_002125 [Enterococcus sp. PF1-24]|uniref:hypothetical protein n=1 Tax=unclassified Enterococcus TaxID=2608891 RepID=UPI002475D7DF|nr:MULTISPECIES: hypothetical protein [unclassified Enterococcus]MDH6365124.1 hypothetical protein [Enterococcus sp. PFB1-1]MDH6402225.1 hypothetical protein [Enterococcus sp. PF1-24]